MYSRSTIESDDKYGLSSDVLYSRADAPDDEASLEASLAERPKK